MHASFLLKDLAVIMATAAIAMYACHRLRQPTIIGYLLAGLIVGPFTPPFALVSDIASIRSISELGLVFLMFSLGLEFNLPRLRKAGIPAAITAAVVVGGMIITGIAAGQVMGWPLPASILLGAILSISGSTIILKVFFDLKVTQEPFARAVFGLMVCDDVVAMIMLSVVSAFSAQSASLASATAFTFVKIVFFILLFLTLGLLLVPKLLNAVAKAGNRELTGITTLGFCFAGAYIAAHFNFSIALGTFLMGAIVAASPQMQEIENWTAPLRDMFSALFFVSAGMLVDPRSLLSNWHSVVIILVLTILARTFWGIAASIIAGYDMRMSVKVGVSSAQIGEFSFILASAAAASGLAPDWLYGVTVAVAMLTTFIFPYLMRNMHGIENVILGNLPGWFTGLCGRYHLLFWKPGVQHQLPERPAIFSKYAMRLAIYSTLSTGIIYGAINLSALYDSLAGNVFHALVWLCAAALLSPMFIAIARYFSHIVLLLVTISIPRLSRQLSGMLDIRLVYDITNVASLSVLGLLFFAAAGYWHEYSPFFLYSAGALLATAVAARRYLLLMMEFNEKLLDQIIGLATSEPFHQMAATAGQDLPMLHNSTTRWLIEENAPFSGKSIRELDIRAKTGTSVISIYRDGSDLPNPAPDTLLLPGDIVILFGSQDQCAAADEYFNKDGGGAA